MIFNITLGINWLESFGIKQTTQNSYRLGFFPRTQEWLFKFDHDLQEFLLCFSKKSPYHHVSKFPSSSEGTICWQVQSLTHLQSTSIKLFGILSEESSYIRQNKMKPLSFLTWDSLERPYIIPYLGTTQETYYMIFTFGLEVWARNRDWRQESRNCKLQIKPFQLFYSGKPGLNFLKIFTVLFTLLELYNSTVPRDLFATKADILDLNESDIIHTKYLLSQS